MKRIFGYLASHWCGEQPLWRATLLNGLAGYLLLIAALLIVNVTVGITARGWFVYAGFVLLVLWMIWSLVGIVRTAWKAMWRRESGLKVGIAAVILLTVAVAVFFLAADLYRLFKPRLG